MPSNQQRREVAKRKLQRQLARRSARAQAQRRRLLIVGVVAAVLVIAGGTWLFTRPNSGADTSDAATTSSASPTAETSTEPATPCAYPASGTPARPVKAPTNLSPPNSGTVDATLTLNSGTVTVALDRKAAPCAVESFVSLATQKFFDGTPCHRLTTAATLKVLQCGDPTGKGSGGPGYSFGDELKPDATYTAGTVAMANSGPDTNGSQFFLVYGNSTLRPNYTVIGKITAGLDVIDAIAKKGVAGGGQDGAPAAPVTLTAVTVPAGAVDGTGTYPTSTAPSADATGAPPQSGGAPAPSGETPPPTVETPAPTTNN